MPTASPFSWKNSRILIADDEPDMREIFSAWFRNLGCYVAEAADGREALDLLSGEPFDVIVTDVRMPRVTGIELVQELHRTGRYTPVAIFVSGYMDLELPDAFDLGIEAVLSKPCEKQELLGAVQRSLMRQQFAFVPPPTVTPPELSSYIRENFSRTATASQVAIGRGGMSFDFPEPILREAPLGFSFSFAQGPLTHLHGWGHLRWCENLPDHSRIGVEFLYLDEESIQQLTVWIQQTCPVSFIPRHGQSHLVSSG
jgi:CheY-like chemotaxis protein